MVNFKIYDVATWLTNSYNTYIACPISHKVKTLTMKFGQLIEHNKRFIFKKNAENEAVRLIAYPFLFF